MQLNEERFQITCEFQEQEICLAFTGKIDTPNPDKQLDPYLAQINDKAIAEGISSVKCNLQELEFLNSNGIKSIVNWILKIKSMPADEQYKVILITSQAYTWQRSSVNVLSLMAPEIVTVQ